MSEKFISFEKTDFLKERIILSWTLKKQKTGFTERRKNKKILFFVWEFFMLFKAFFEVIFSVLSASRSRPVLLAPHRGVFVLVCGLFVQAAA